MWVHITDAAHTHVRKKEERGGRTLAVSLISTTVLGARRALKAYNWRRRLRAYAYIYETRNDERHILYVHYAVIVQATCGYTSDKLQQKWNKVCLVGQCVLHNMSKVYRNILSGTGLNSQLNFSSYFGEFCHCQRSFWWESLHLMLQKSYVKVKKMLPFTPSDTSDTIRLCIVSYFNGWLP